MAKISLNDSAPEGVKTVSLGNAVVDVSEGAYETNDYNVVSDARVHPFLEVEGEIVIEENVESPSEDASVETQSPVSADPANSSEGQQEVAPEVVAQAEGQTAKEQQRGRRN